MVLRLFSLRTSVGKGDGGWNVILATTVGTIWE